MSRPASPKEWQYIVGVLDVQPGETLVVRFKHDPTPEQMNMAWKAAQDSVPAGVKVLVLGPEIDLQIVKKSAAA